MTRSVESVVSWGIRDGKPFVGSIQWMMEMMEGLDF